MRVSNRFLYYQLVKDIGTSAERLFNLNGQISSGKRINSPSDDPIGLSKVLMYRTELNALSEFKKSISLADGWISRTDSICSQVDELLTRASELAVQAASSTANADTRTGAAEEIEEIREMMLGYANSKYGNKYIFGGTQTQTAPFLSVDISLWQDDVDTMAEDNAGAEANLGGAAEGDRYINTEDGNIYEHDGTAWQVSEPASEGISSLVTDKNELYIYSGGKWVPQYGGNSSTFSTKIGKEDMARINLPGNDVFRNPEGDVFLALMRLEKALRDNDQKGIRDQLPAIENSSKAVMIQLSKVGAVVNRLDQTKSVIENTVVDINTSRADIEDLDYADALTQLSNQQTIYQAALKSASLITNMSLVDFI